MAAVSVVIPHHGDVEGAYLTAAAASVQLDASGLEHEIIFVADNPNAPAGAQCSPQFPSKAYTVNCGSPQGARDYGIKRAASRYVFCLDSHVVCSDGFFSMAKSLMYLERPALVFPGMALHSRSQKYWGFKLDENSFWSAGYHNEPDAKIMASGKYAHHYPIQNCGHGAFLVDRDIYLQTGGYCLEQKGWGGEETFLNLKMWMLGYQCFMMPQYFHWHYMDRSRNTTARLSEGFKNNFAIAAYAIGGEAAMQRVYRHFDKTLPWRAQREADIVKRATPEREKILAGPYGGDFGKLKKFFVENDIP